MHTVIELENTCSHFRISFVTKKCCDELVTCVTEYIYVGTRQQYRVKHKTFGHCERHLRQRKQ